MNNGDGIISIINAPEGYRGGFGAVCGSVQVQGKGKGKGGRKNQKIKAKDYDSFNGIFKIKSTTNTKKTKRKGGYTGFGITGGEPECAREAAVVVKGAGGCCYVDKIPREYCGDFPARNGGGSLVFEQLFENQLQKYILRGLLPKRSKAEYLRIYNQFVCWINTNNIQKINELIIIGYFNHLRDGLGRAPIMKEYSMIKKAFLVIQHTDIDYEKNKWNLAKD